jgi:hypothetical protein
MKDEPLTAAVAPATGTTFDIRCARGSPRPIGAASSRCRASAASPRHSPSAGVANRFRPTAAPRGARHNAGPSPLSGDTAAARSLSPARQAGRTSCLGACGSLHESAIRRCWRRSSGPARRVPHMFPNRQIEDPTTPSIRSEDRVPTPKGPANSALIIRRELIHSYRTASGMNAYVWETVSGDVARKGGCEQTKGPLLRAFLEAAEGTRTLDLLHGKHPYRGFLVRRQLRFARLSSVASRKRVPNWGHGSGHVRIPTRA